jgi:hypothetical protein
MHAALLSRPQEVTMFTRRIVASTCALALLAPAAAVARPADNGPAVNRGGVVYGDTKYDLQNQQDLNGGDAADRVDRIGSLTPQQLAAAYGTTQPKGSPVLSAQQFSEAYGATAPNARFVPASATTPATSSKGDDNDGWQIAAISEAALIALLACGSAAVVVRARRRVTA